MRILSLFDGMSCGMLAFERAGVPVDSYDAYEIDKYAMKVSAHNYPQIRHHGDVFQADFTQYEGVDFVIGGSPCTYWSVAQSKGRETEAHGIGWELFRQYVRAIEEAKPRYFIYENNKSMAQAIRDEITVTFGFEPICINSALVSAQNRQRLYWVGIRQEDGTYRKTDIGQPMDKGILLKDVLEGESWTDKSYALTTRCMGAIPEDTLKRHRHTMVAEVVGVGYRNRREDDGQLYRRFETHGEEKSNCLTTVQTDSMVAGSVRGMDYDLKEAFDRDDGVVATLDMPGYEMIARVYGAEGKSPTLTTMAGGHRQPKVFSDATRVKSKTKAQVYEVKGGHITIKGKEYPIKLADGQYIIRKLTVNECKRLQTVPDSYDMTCISDTQAYKCLGNGWTVDVIAHLLEGALNGTE